LSYTIILHLPNEDPLLADIEELPKPGDNFVLVSNMRKVDGTQLGYLDTEADKVLLPWHRINYIEVRPSEAEKTEVAKFFRE
jgi:hypothetical protein